MSHNCGSGPELRIHGGYSSADTGHLRRNRPTQHGTDYGPLNAFIFMSAIPVLIVYLLFQRYFVQGALAGAVKG